MRLLNAALLTVCVSLGALSCRKSSSPVPRLEFLWETEPVFSYPESAVYDPVRQQIYVSNIGETPPDNPANRDGFISTLGLDGQIRRLRWIEGLNDPKGMDLGKETLWVNDRDAVVEVDLKSESVRRREVLPNVVFLNDIGVGPEGEVFSNDADGHKVLTLVDGQWEVFWEDPEEGRPNGIRVESDRLLLAMNWSHQLIALDRNSRKQTLLLDKIGAGDGIERLEDGGYLITDFLGQVFYLDPSGVGHPLLDSRGEKHTADLEYIEATRKVIIPRHKNHTVAAYQLVWD